METLAYPQQLFLVLFLESHFQQMVRLQLWQSHGDSLTGSYPKMNLLVD